MFIVAKRPGEAARLIEQREPVTLGFLQEEVGGYVEMFPRLGQISELFDDLTIYMNEDGRAKGLPVNVRFPLDEVVGALVVCLRGPDGTDIGMDHEQAEAVARALDHYSVGREVALN